MALPTAERLAWDCGDHTAKLESASGGRLLITRICCSRWHAGERGEVRVGTPTQQLEKAPPLEVGSWFLKFGRMQRGAGARRRTWMACVRRAYACFSAFSSAASSCVTPGASCVKTKPHAVS